MYKATVTARVMSDKDALRLLAPVFVWLALTLVTLFTMCVTEFWLLVLPLFFVFVSIIPVFWWSARKAKRLRQKSLVKMDITLTARDGVLYKGDMKLNALWCKQDNEVYLDQKLVFETKFHPHIFTTFFAVISGDDVEGFIRFCQEHKVQVDIFPEYIDDERQSPERRNEV